MTAEKQKKKILILNCVYGFGSTGFLSKSIFERMQKEDWAEARFVAGRNAGNKTFDDKDVKLVAGTFYSRVQHLLANLDGHVYEHCGRSTRSLIKYIAQYNPDLINIHCINGYFVNIPYLFSWIGKKGIPTVITQHAEFYFTGSCSHAFGCEKFKEFPGCDHCPRPKSATGAYFANSTAHNNSRMKYGIDSIHNLTCVSVSPWLMNESKKSLLLGKKKNITIVNGVDTSIFFYQERLEKSALPISLQKLRYILVFMPNHSKMVKGFKYLNEFCSLLSGWAKVAIVGCEKNDFWNENAILLGNISDKKVLADIYRASVCHVCLSEWETFSMTICESACCGTPSFSFFAGGPETVFSDDFCRFAQKGNVVELIGLIKNFSYDNDNRKIRSEKASAKFSIETMTETYLRLFKNVLHYEN